MSTSSRVSGTYFIVLVVLDIEAARSDMMALIPNRVDQSGVICVVLHDLVMCDLVAAAVFVITVSQLKDTLDIPASERGVSLLCGDRWPHIAKDHCVMP